MEQLSLNLNPKLLTLNRTPEEEVLRIALKHGVKLSRIEPRKTRDTAPPGLNSVTHAPNLEGPGIQSGKSALKPEP